MNTFIPKDVSFKYLYIYTERKNNIHYSNGTFDFIKKIKKSNKICVIIGYMSKPEYFYSAKFHNK